MANRAVLFVDGNNLYHSLRARGVRAPGQLNYAKISQKLVQKRQWLETRYYIGRVLQTGNLQIYAKQRRFLASLLASDNRISVHFGRIEQKPYENPAAAELNAYLDQLQVRIDRSVFQELRDLARRHHKSLVMVEKAVDVLLAVDMVTMAQTDGYDTAYLLSADGDYTPAIHHLRSLGKVVYAASPSGGSQLAAAVSRFIPLGSSWFADCYH